MNTTAPTTDKESPAKPTSYNEKVSRTVLKAISWRVIASFTTFLITFLIVRVSGYELSTLSAVDISFRVTVFEAVAKMAIYFFHERAWLRISYGKILPLSNK